MQTPPRSLGNGARDMAFGGQLPNTSAPDASLGDYRKLTFAAAQLLRQLTAPHEPKDVCGNSHRGLESPGPGQQALPAAGRSWNEGRDKTIETTGTSMDPAEAARELWQLVTATVERLSRTEAALRAREAQLAAAIPVIERPDDVARLADRLEASLRVAVETLKATSAALYLLDDATSELKLRAAWNLPKERFLQPARPLANQFADLEALLGHAVVLDRDDRQCVWQPPEPCQVAVCVPVSTPSIPLGTLWVFDQRSRSFSDRQLELLEVIAGRVAADLERHVLLQATANWHRQLKSLTVWADAYQRQLPTLRPWLKRWRFHAQYRQPQTGLPHEFYDWGVLPNGRAYLVVGGCHGADPSATMRALALRAATQAHLVHVDSPGPLLQAVNETLWIGSTGDWQGSLFCALADDQSGAIQYAGSGYMSVWVAGHQRWRPLKLDRTPLGCCQSLSAASDELVVPRRGLLCVLGPAYTQVVSQPQVVAAKKPLGGEFARKAAAATRKNRCPAKLIEGFLKTSVGYPPCQESTVVVAQRLA